MNKVKDTNYVCICGWMINRLELKGNDLFVYAVIYSYSQYGERFNGSLAYLSKWINGTKQGIQKNLRNLIDAGLIEKREKVVNNVKYCEYRVLFEKIEETKEETKSDDFPTSENHSEQIKEYKPEKITEDINNVIFLLKEQADKIGIAYDKTDERKFAKHILTAKEYNAFANKCGYDPIEFAKLIMQASVQVDYWKGACAGPKTIYQNYPDVFNKVIKEKNKIEKNKIVSF